ncbi:alpha/beta fold hydrolase [Rapidithrix thailandica]|uniref:Alpha/beta fold hydrolase n=1 Tax=Rapidithrix thailandica TaxID=413964 RepID=A0AAW9S7A3_9BACT
MQQLHSTEFILTSLHHQRPMLVDACWQVDAPAPVVIFVHGFKGFKDWGAWQLVAEQCAAQEVNFVKVNLSHNGTTPEQPLDFADLEAFGNNNFCIELDDIQVLIDYLFDHAEQFPTFDLDKIYLIGHSRGGGLVLLKAREDSRIRKVATWASISTVEHIIKTDELAGWKEKGVYYIYNGRTKQNMPLYYQLAENFLANRERLSIENAVRALEIPYLIVHGTADESVRIDSARQLKDWASGARLLEVTGAGHTFGAYHPYDQPQLPAHLQVVVDKTLSFFKT